MRAAGHSEIRAFIEIAEQASFSRAAERIGVSPSSLSQTIRGFEERLGVRLLQRTTRSVALTEAGQRLLNRVRPAISELDAALVDIGQLREAPAGLVRVRSLRHAFKTVIEPMLADFHAAYPDIMLDISVDDAAVDLVAAGFDVGFTLGEVLEKDLVAVRLGADMRQIAVASPEYIAAHGCPETPKALLSHKCLRWRWAGRQVPYNWEFFADGAWFEVEVKGPLIFSEAPMAVEAALRGLGVAFWVEHELRPLIDSGRLVGLLEAWSGPFPGLHLCYPQQRQMAPALRAFIDFVRGGRAAS